MSTDPWNERYREQVRLTGSEVPNAVLSQLDAVWAQREEWAVAETVSSAYVNQAEFLDMVEKSLRERALRLLAARGWTPLTSTGPQWTQQQFTFGVDTPGARERPWVRGTALEEAVGVVRCTMSGLGLPLLTEEA